MEDQRFPRENHLLQRRDFLHAYELGRRSHGRLVVVFCLDRQDEGPWRVGLTVTKKTAASAVVRNRLRRRVREFFRRRRGKLPRGWDFVVNCKGPAREADSVQLGQDLTQALTRLGFGSAVSPAIPIKGLPEA